MKPGDLVRVKRSTVLPCNTSLSKGEMGIIVKKTYEAYDPEYSKWLVIFKDSPRKINQSNLTKVEC